MDMRDSYLKMISGRGDSHGHREGLLDLLDWCGKSGLYQVTEEDAKRYWENPRAPYCPAEKKS